MSSPPTFSTPIKLADGSDLQVLEIVRTIPNKRMVCRASWQERTVYAKLFFGVDAAKYAARDASGVGLLAAANINAPCLLYQGEAADKSSQILLFEAIEPAVNVEAIWPTLTTKQRINLARSLVVEIAKHHDAGLIQTDLYLKNFLVAANVIYTLDGDGIRSLSGIFKKHQTQCNLATFFSKMDVLDDEWMRDLYERYCKQLGVSYSPFNEAEIWSLTQKIRRQAVSGYADKKVFRQCTDVYVSRQNGLFTAISSQFSRMDLPQTPAQADTYFTQDSLLKNGNTCTVALGEVDGTKIVIKRYNIKSFWHGVSRAFRQTRAAVSWANAHRLQLLGVPTVKPVALIEERKFGLRGRAYFLCEYIDAPDAAQFFAECTDRNARSEAVKNIATLFYRLYLLRISHGDTKANNIKIVDNKPVLIDLDSMAQHTFASSALKAHVRDLRRFMQNWQGDQALYNAFIKTFKVIYVDHTPLKMAGIL